MATQTLTLGGERFVVIPEKEYLNLKAQKTAPAVRSGKGSSRRSRSRHDAGDVAEARRRAGEPVTAIEDFAAELGINIKSARR